MQEKDPNIAAREKILHESFQTSLIDAELRDMSNNKFVEEQVRYFFEKISIIPFKDATAELTHIHTVCTVLYYSEDKYIMISLPLGKKKPEYADYLIVYSVYVNDECEVRDFATLNQVPDLFKNI